MYFKWVTCLLLRQFSMKTCLRLFDTYLAIESNYFGFCLYILAAIILKYSKKFKKMGFEEMMIFQQNMPTKEWSEEDLATVIAEAYVYQSYFLKWYLRCHHPPTSSHLIPHITTPRPPHHHTSSPTSSHLIHPHHTLRAYRHWKQRNIKIRGRESSRRQSWRSSPASCWDSVRPVEIVWIFCTAGSFRSFRRALLLHCTWGRRRRAGNQP